MQMNQIMTSQSTASLPGAGEQVTEVSEIERKEALEKEISDLRGQIADKQQEIDNAKQ